MSSMAFQMKDALTKVCPVRQDGGVDRNCLGHKCMAWVWCRNDENLRAVENRSGYCAMPGTGL